MVFRGYQRKFKTKCERENSKKVLKSMGFEPRILTNLVLRAFPVPHPEHKEKPWERGWTSAIPVQRYNQLSYEATPGRAGHSNNPNGCRFRVVGPI